MSFSNHICICILFYFFEEFVFGWTILSFHFKFVLYSEILGLVSFSFLTSSEISSLYFRDTDYIILKEVNQQQKNSLNNRIEDGILRLKVSCGLGDRCSISGRVIPKTQKVVLDTSLLNTQHYKVRFKGKVEHPREWSSALPYTSV